MSHYLKYFAAVYSIALFLLVSILIYGLKLGAITLLPGLIASAFLNARHFVKKEQRLPERKRKKQTGLGINSNRYEHWLYHHVYADFYTSAC